MSMSRSASIDSSASTATVTTLTLAGLPANSSNGLYEDRDHFQSIFTNDSRFFDTSLHLFKSYNALGYIPIEDEKHNQLHVPVLHTRTSREHKHRWKPRLLGLHHRHAQENHHSTLKGFLTPILLRKTDQTNRVRAESGNSNTETNNPQRTHSLVVHYQQASVPSISISDGTKSDESEVTITRL